MTQKLYNLTVSGETKNWVFRVWENPKYISEWVEEGIKIEKEHEEFHYWLIDTWFPLKKIYALNISGKNRKYSFDVALSKKHVGELLSDGIRVEEVLNSIPKWWVDIGLSVHVFCFFQDLLNFRNPFEK